MFKPFFVFFGVLFFYFVKAESIANDSTDLHKSFTATCEGVKSCFYSLVLSTIEPSKDYGATVFLTIGTETNAPQFFIVEYGDPKTLNFEVGDGVDVRIDIIPSPSANPLMLFRVYNKEDGKGE